MNRGGKEKEVENSKKEEKNYEGEEEGGVMASFSSHTFG